MSVKNESISLIDLRVIKPTFSLVPNNIIANCFAIPDTRCILSGTQPRIKSKANRSNKGERV